jgi:hypothetical protein
MRNQFKPSDLSDTAPCGICDRPVSLHGAPLGEPAFLLMLGFCQHCKRTELTIRVSDQVTYTQSPTLQLAGMFVKLADRERHVPE